MTTHNLLLTLLCVAGISAGQILFRLAGRTPLPGEGALAILNGWMIAALVLYGAATLLWVHVLRSTPLSIAYPLFALAFVIVPVLSFLILHEPLRVSSFVGGALIMLGVVVSTRGG